MENPTKQRIRDEYEYKDIKSYPFKDFLFHELYLNPYEWHGALKGPARTDLEGGIYHVRLLFPQEYPWEEPSFIFLRENGSLNIKTKVTLNWDPSRRMRQTFLDLIDLMHECPNFESDSETEFDEPGLEAPRFEGLNRLSSSLKDDALTHEQSRHCKASDQVGAENLVMATMMS
ncbi:PREDICTED: ubiquitin-conjugating enzyme E2 32-like [Prunus mume]|uniref:Ubiquitin-conjugating enzyme E2 32-like n=1 Tax=Prunus mume TaxID=102107 RepID=A0ABM0NM01_PRUMU|nr:PREDICTED: ubiquitin-conjugating enzyme E2 32-like [Prunus mume]